MISNYYILHSAVREIRERLIGLKFVRAYSIRSAELRIEFENEYTIVAQLQPAHTTLYHCSSAEREPKRNVLSFFKELEGQEVQNIRIAAADKIVTIDFAEVHLLLRFYDGPNALLMSGEEVIAEFKRERKKAKAPLESTAVTPAEKNTIRQKLPMLGKWLEAELVQIITGKGSTVDVDEECRKFDALLRETAGCFLYSLSGSVLLSPIRLRSLTENYKRYESISDAIEFVTKSRTKQTSFKSKRDGLVSKLHGALVRTQKALSDAKSGIENSARAEKYTAIGEGIMAMAHTLEKGMESVELLIFDKSIQVVLDPSISPYENSKRYYDKARRAKLMQTELQARLITLERELEKISQFSQTLSQTTEVREVEALERVLAKEGFALSHTADDLGDDNDPIARFRKFTVAGGFRVLVGKNAKQNDELTLHVAKKEDLWFHARHVPGSHVVLQIGSGKQVPKESIIEAAEIAAYYSDARTQKHAPVAYTKKKFVRKPRGAAPGAVALEREEVIMVSPKNPETKL
ncbi:MAG: NFACT RNA binding domain-containing protein [Ignavibacteriota bacterium]